MNKHNQQGFSLVQVVVAMGLAGGLAVFLMRLGDQQVKQQKTMEMKASLLDIEQTIRQALFDDTICYHTFKQTFPGGTLDGIRTSGDPSAPFWAKVGEPFKSTDVKIDEMYMLTRAEEIDPDFGNGTPLRPDPNPANIIGANGVGKAYLKVTFSKGKSANDNSRFFGGKTTAKIFVINAKFSTPQVMYRCDHAAAKAECENPANIPPNGSAKYTGPIDEDGTPGPDTVDLGDSGCSGTSIYVVGKCTIFDPAAGVVSCHNSTPP